MRAAVASILLLGPAFLLLRSTLGEPDAAAIRGAFDRADLVLRAQASRRRADFDRVPEGDWAFARLLPVGHWRLLVEAFPDVAFERYSTGLDGPFPDERVAAWGIHALAQLGYPPVRQLLRGRLRSKDPEVFRHAVRLLGVMMDPSQTTRLLAGLPASPQGYDDHQHVMDVLQTATSSLPPDVDAVRRALDRFAKLKGEDWYGLTTPRLQLAFLTAADPVREAERLLFESKDDATRDEFEEWLPAYAARRKLAALAPVLRRRVEKETALQVAEENAKFLDPAGSGEPLDPQFDAAWGFRGAFVLAAHRKALRDLGIPLTEEERRWLDAHRLLRPARTYLVEAGILNR